MRKKKPKFWYRVRYGNREDYFRESSAARAVGAAAEKLKPPPFVQPEVWIQNEVGETKLI